MRPHQCNFPPIASTMFIREARQAGMPVLSRLSTKQKNNAHPKVETCINMDASTMGGLSV